MIGADRLGEIERNDGYTTVLFVRNLGHTQEKVWEVLTETKHMRYWMPVDLRGAKEPGSTFDVEFWPDLAEAKGIERGAGSVSIEEWDPPRTLEWTWNLTRIRFETEPTSDGCRLRLTVTIDTESPDEIVDAASGFHLWLDHLTNLLDTGSSPSLAHASPRPLEALYRVILPDR